jgi:hypothetical protein
MKDGYHMIVFCAVFFAITPDIFITMTHCRDGVLFHAITTCDAAAIDERLLMTAD